MASASGSPSPGSGPSPRSSSPTSSTRGTTSSSARRPASTTARTATSTCPSSSGHVGRRRARRTVPLAVHRGDVRAHPRTQGGGTVHPGRPRRPAAASPSRSDPRIKEQLIRREPERVYLAVVTGARRRPRARGAITSSGTGARWHRRRPTTGTRAAPRPSALTASRRCSAARRSSRCGCTPGSGIEIRIQAALRGHPLIGERQYPGLAAAPHARSITFRRQALHAWQLRFEHPHDRRPLAFEAPLPRTSCRSWSASAGEPPVVTGTASECQASGSHLHGALPRLARHAMPRQTRRVSPRSGRGGIGRNRTHRLKKADVERLTRWDRRWGHHLRGSATILLFHRARYVPCL